jgi:hypothetical protein
MICVVGSGTRSARPADQDPQGRINRGRRLNRSVELHVGHFAKRRRYLPFRAVQVEVFAR